MVDASDIQKYFEYAKELTLEAGQIIEKALNAKKTVELKDGEWDVVTNYDREVEQFFMSNLSTKFSDHKFIAEETSSQGSIPELTNDPTWIIDPIDGTVNFTHSCPEICISIALAIEKRLYIGIIYNPVRKELYTAKKNQGAFLNGKRLQTSQIKELKKALMSKEPSTIHLSQRNRDITQGRLEALATAAQGMRTNGSSALTLAYIARGILDGFECSGLKCWDLAAGVLIVQEAGGFVCDSKGGPYEVTKTSLIIAASTELASEVTKLIVETDLKTQRKRLKRT